jgi:hypothetical protein
MSKPNLELAFPQLLRERIREFKIPDAPGQIAWEEVMIYQIPDEEMGGDKFGKDSALYKPETVADGDRRRCPRGVIVSAGLGAMGMLRDHGMQVGEMVLFSPHAPNRFQVSRSDGKMVEFFFMHVSDVQVSEDIPGRLVSGDLKLVYEKGDFLFIWKGDKSRSGRRDPKQFDDGI